MQLNFTKVILLSFSRKTTGGTAKFSSSLTAPVKTALGWGDVPDWQRTSQPVGKLHASRIELKPESGIGLGKGIELETTSVDGFEIVRTEAKGKTAKKTKSFKTELLFAVHFGDLSGAKKLEQYMLTANVNAATMNVTYEKEPEQEELPGTSDADATGELEEQVEEIRKKRGKRED